MLSLKSDSDLSGVTSALNISYPFVSEITWMALLTSATLVSRDCFRFRFSVSNLEQLQANMLDKITIIKTDFFMDPNF
jgi:hypothetical protein